MHERVPPLLVRSLCSFVVIGVLRSLPYMVPGSSAGILSVLVVSTEVTDTKGSNKMAASGSSDTTAAATVTMAIRLLLVCQGLTRLIF